MIKNPYLGKFIVFEGLDGSGQSTQADLLRNFLTEKGFEVILTKEPTQDSQASREIRETLGKKIKITPQKLQELFTQDRREHLENLIIPALKEGKMVISDRYFFSTFAYGVFSGLDLTWLMKINDEFLIPDATFILKVRPEICVSRIEKRGSAKTLFEEVEKLSRVWQTYAILPNHIENAYIINGEKIIEEVFAEVKLQVHSKLNL
ncbi:MAG: putative thymidylate kinase [Parcubacteria group bacterium GW2011_GWF2_43_11]|nr:MAG: putative thymidylate kinase [Parcubacteria group bacterium GW2011_GWF2_43_11]